MEHEEIIESLSPIERKAWPHIEDGITVNELASKAECPLVEATRAAQFLNNKGLLDLIPESALGVSVTALGKEVLDKGLPEKRLLKLLSKPRSFAALREESGLDKNELNIAIGILKKQDAIRLGNEVSKEKDLDFSEKEELLRQIASGGSGEVPQELFQRGLVEKVEKKTHRIAITDLGKELLGKNVSGEYIEKLTHDMLKTGSWKDKKFRKYDVKSPVPSTLYGRQHYVQDAMDYIKRLWIEMGFTEMEGDNVQSAFWDLDALFVPQDHPAREMQDTFYLKKTAELPDWWQNIKEVHENGGDTGSTGWQTEYSEEEAKKVLLRTHTTVLSAQMLKQLKPEDLPAKFFSVAKVFRNETMDWKHLFEFHQVEGIVVGEGLSLADLIGLQKEFYKKMGFPKIRFRPGYFPYTEPSCEVEAWHPGKEQWIELGGMGVFRPEVVKPLLGKDIPVLAWGLGMERIIVDYYGIKDLRDIYTKDLSKIRNAKKFLMEDH